MLHLFLLACTAALAQAAVASVGSVYVSTKANTGCTSGDAQTVAPGRCIRSETVQAPEPGTIDPKAFHEYVIKTFPNCPSGKPAAFVIYEDSTCRREQTRIKGGDGVGKCQQVSEEFRSAAFSCPDFVGTGDDDGNSNTASTDTTAVAASTESQSSATSAPYDVTAGSGTTSAAATATSDSATTGASTDMTTDASAGATGSTSLSTHGSTGMAALFTACAEWAGLAAMAAALV